MIIQCIKKCTADHRANNLLTTDTDGKAEIWKREA